MIDRFKARFLSVVKSSTELDLRNCAGTEISNATRTRVTGAGAGWRGSGSSTCGHNDAIGRNNRTGGRIIPSGSSSARNNFSLIIHRSRCSKVGRDSEGVIESVGLSASALGGCICSGLGTRACILRSLICAARVGESVANKLGYDVDILS